MHAIHRRNGNAWGIPYTARRNCSEKLYAIIGTGTNENRLLQGSSFQNVFSVQQLPNIAPPPPPPTSNKQHPEQHNAGEAPDRSNLREGFWLRPPLGGCGSVLPSRNRTPNRRSVRTESASCSRGADCQGEFFSEAAASPSLCLSTMLLLQLGHSCFLRRHGR